MTEVVSDDSFDAFLEQWEREQQEERERMKSEQNRLDSFDPIWLGCFNLDISVAQRLAKAGFYSLLRATECFSCGLSKHLSFWQEGHDPKKVHREESPNCKFITGQSDNVPIDISFFTKILHYLRPSRTNNRKTLNNNITTQHVVVKEQISNQFESNSRGSIVIGTDVKQNKISQKTEKEAKFRNPRNDVRAESIEESTVAFTSQEPDVGNKKAASSSTCQRECLISATRGSCSSQEINQNSVIVSHSLQSSAFRTETVTQEEYVACGDSVTSVGTAERRSPIVSLLNKLHLPSFCELSVGLLICSK